MKLVKVWQHVLTDGYTEWYGGCYRSPQLARLRSDYERDPKERDAILFDDGSVWMLDEHRKHDGFVEDIEARVAAAKAKLTEDERKLLGIK